MSFTAEPSERVATRADLEWKVEAARLQEEALPAIRSAAEKWGSTVAALLGLLSIGALVKGPNDVRKVTGSLGPIPWETVVGVLVGAAFVLAAGAVVLAALAAQGSIISIRPTAQGAKSATHRATASAARQLNASRVTALLAIPLLALAVAIVWIQTPGSEPGTKVLVTRTNGDLMCGTLASGRGEIRVDEGDKDAVIPLDEVKTIKPTSKCP